MKADDDERDATAKMEMAAAHGVGAGHQADADRSGRDHFLCKRRGESVFEEGIDSKIERDDGRTERSGLCFHSVDVAACEGQGHRCSWEGAGWQRAPV